MWSAFLHTSAHRVEDDAGVSSERGRMCCGATETIDWPKALAAGGASELRRG